MFNFRSTSKLVVQIQYFFASKHRVFDKKNNSILIVQDLNSNLPYMAEVQLSDSSRGVVLKIEQTKRAYLAMYEQLKPSSQKGSQIQIVKVTKKWRESLGSLIHEASHKEFESKGISRAYDVNVNSILERSQNNTKQNNSSQIVQIWNGKKRRLKSSSPILNICHDLYYGDMISFMGCKGSKKSYNGWNIAKQFALNSHNNLPIYLNPNIHEVKSFSQLCPHSIAFTLPQNKKPTDAGVYMLALKAIKLSEQLKKQGVNVLLIVDNLSEIMYREWNLLQSIKFDSSIDDSSKIFQYNTLRIPPISILNEIYSNCQDTFTEKAKAQNLKQNPNKRGSMTSILISEKENNELVQQITSYSNNLKHLQTLSHVIEFPLNFKINTNLYYPKPKSQEQFETIKQQQGFEEKELHRFLRSYINKYLNEKKQTQLKRQLYKNDIKDAPWDYFFLLDSEWWINGIKQVGNTSKSFKQANQFLKWIVFNIQNDYLGHWNLSAHESYRKFMDYLRNLHNLEVSTPAQTIFFNQEDMESFIEDVAKMQGFMNPFKKDYLI